MSGNGLESELANARMEQQRAHEINSAESNLEAISPVLLKVTGLEVHRKVKSLMRQT